MPQVMYNAKGTTNSFYNISGITGISIFQGYSGPSDSLGNNGDVFFTKGEEPKILRKINGEWKDISSSESSFEYNIEFANTSQTIDFTNNTVVFVDSTSESIDVTLSSNMISSGFSIIIKDYKGTSETNPITIKTESSETIDGDDEKIVSLNRASLTLVSDGDDWFII